MKTYGEVIHVDVCKMAKGLYDMIIEHGYKGVLGFGMLPHDLMMSFETNLDNRFPSTDLMIGEVYVEEKDIIRYKKDIIHDVRVQIYKIASDNGIMVV